MGTETTNAGSASMPPLTPREEEVLEHVLRGETNKEIAAALGCSDKTIEYHMRNILRKTQTSSRTRLMASRMRGTKEVGE
jgi:DNA-binding NarL/FixJ family response regulator